MECENSNFVYQYNQEHMMQLYVNHQMVKKIYQVKFVEDLMMIELNQYIYLNRRKFNFDFFWIDKEYKNLVVNVAIR